MGAVWATVFGAFRTVVRVFPEGEVVTPKKPHQPPRGCRGVGAGVGAGAGAGVPVGGVVGVGAAPVFGSPAKAATRGTALGVPRPVEVS